MTTPQQPSGTAVPIAEAGPRRSHPEALACGAHGRRASRRLPLWRRLVVGLLTGATTVAWLLLAAALTAETATYVLRACTRRDGAPPMTECGTQRNELHASGSHVDRDDGVALPAAYRRQQP